MDGKKNMKLTRYLALYYVLPAGLQLLFLVISNSILFETQLLYTLCQAQFFPWFISFVLTRTLAAVFMANDLLTTFIGFFVSNAFVWYQLKELRWPGQQTMVASTICFCVVSLVVWVMVQRKKNNPPEE